MTRAFYNEIDPYAAAWLRNLISAGHITPGVVDERSIVDLRPSDLDGFDRVHFFAGIGVWDYALGLAGWPADRPVWTGSCPCQPFSAAGKGGGFADERHLWPAWHHLIQECRPATILGEQVASGPAGPWLDLVFDDLEGVGYACGAIPFPAASVGAPNLRDRLWWLAYSDGDGREQRRERRSALGHGAPTQSDRVAGVVADPASEQCTRALQEPRGRSSLGGEGMSLGRCGHAGGLGNAEFISARRDAGAGAGPQEGPRLRAERNDAGAPGAAPWAAIEWLPCRDGKWRPTQPGLFPLAHGAPARVGRLRAYGNAINAEAACSFIESVIQAIP